MKAQLAQIADIQLGVYAQPSHEGNTAYLLVRHFDEMAKLSGQPDAFIMTEPVPTPHDLRTGDVLLTAKGTRQFAWAYEERVGPAVASPAFFVIRPSENLILASYLAIVLNTPGMRTALQTRAKGSNIPSIRKSEVETLEVNIPPLEVQEKVTELTRLHDMDMALSRRLIREKEKLYQAAIGQLMNRVIPIFDEPHGKQTNFSIGD